MNRQLLRNSLLLLLTAAIWGFAFTAQSVGLDYVGPFTFTAVRSIIGGVVLFPIIVFRGRDRNQGTAGRRKVLCGGVLCGALLCIASNLQQIGLKYTTVGKSGFITAMYIVLVPVFGIFLHRKIGLKIWMAVGLAVCGLYLLCMNGGAFLLSRGDLLTFLCAVAFSFQIMSVDYFAPQADGIQLACIQYFVCGLLSVVPCLLFEHPAFSNILQAWVPILYAGILSNGVAYTLQIVAQKNMKPEAASLLMSMESVFSVLGGWLVLHQKLTGRELAGCALMFAAIILVQIRGKDRENEEYH